MKQSDRLWGRKPPAHGLLWLLSGLLRAQVWLARRCDVLPTRTRTVTPGTVSLSTCVTRPPSSDAFLIHRTRSPQAGVRARLTGPNEARGMDGRGFQGPGLDHGVFIPFRLMFGEEFRGVPIVQASIDGSLNPESNWNLGKAIAKLRCVYSVLTTHQCFFCPRVFTSYRHATSHRDEGILVLSGGLTIHNLQDRTCFLPETANPLVREFNDAVSSAISVSDVSIIRQSVLYLALLTALFQSPLRGGPHSLPSHDTKVFAWRTHERNISSPSMSQQAQVKVVTCTSCLACMGIKQLHSVESVHSERKKSPIQNKWVIKLLCILSIVNWNKCRLNG